jgi:IMP and pyridine-specific 5'-nucleotidase
MKSMLNHSFVLDALDTTGADTFSHFEMLIDEHRRFELEGGDQPSRLKQLVPTVGTFHTRLPLRKAFAAYNAKHRITQRRHICISFNEIRHILNLAQIMAMRPVNEAEDMKDWAQESIRQTDSGFSDSPNSPEVSGILPQEAFSGPKMMTFDGDQTLYSDGKNFEDNLRLANYLYLLLKHGVTVAVVTAAGYEYHAEKYEFRLSGLLTFFEEKGLSEADCERFYLFGGECNYLLRVST